MSTGTFGPHSDGCGSRGDTAPANHLPDLSVVVFTYNRRLYLNELLQSLLEQDDDTAFELVVFDNGSDSPVSETHSALLRSFRGGVKVLREESNFLSPRRFMSAIEASSGQWVLLPGDDDVVLPNYISTMRRLAGGSPQASMVSTAFTNIDADGAAAPGGGSPPAFRTQAQALAHLLQSNQYGMPASGFRRSAIDLAAGPMTRSSFDWWLWIQAWLAGPAAVSSEVAVHYRVHTGQEQHSYGSQSFALDGARMIDSVISETRFRQAVAAWTEPERAEFVELLLKGPGLNNGDSRWGPFLQVRLVDALIDILDSSTLQQLFGQASAQAGIIPAIGALRTVSNDPSIASLSETVWSRVPISAEWCCDCACSVAWRQYLQVPEAPRARVHLTFVCAASTESQHRPEVTLADWSGAETRIKIACEPSEAAAAQLFETIGLATGRPHGFEPIRGVEARTVNLIRRVRAFTWTRRVERAIRFRNDPMSASRK